MNIKQTVLASVIALAAFGVPSYAQTSPEPTTVVKKVKVKRPKPIKNKDIQKSQKQLSGTTSEKGLQKANAKRIKDQQNALRKRNKNAAANFKAQQKTNAKKLRDEQRRVRKSQ
jgi:hypothetical protein